MDENVRAWRTGTESRKLKAEAPGRETSLSTSIHITVLQ